MISVVLNLIVRPDVTCAKVRAFYNKVGGAIILTKTATLTAHPHKHDSLRDAQGNVFTVRDVMYEIDAKKRDSIFLVPEGDATYTTDEFVALRQTGWQPVSENDHDQRLWRSL